MPFADVHSIFGLIWGVEELGISKCFESFSGRFIFVYLAKNMFMLERMAAVTVNPYCLSALVVC